mgnify:CR=1 FL=1
MRGYQTHQFNKKRGLLTIEPINDELSIVIESNYQQYQGITAVTKIDRHDECERYFLERKFEVSPPKLRTNHNTRI